MAKRKIRVNAPPEPPIIQLSLFKAGDVWVCPFCCEPLARVGGGVLKALYPGRVRCADSP